MRQVALLVLVVFLLVGCWKRIDDQHDQSQSEEDTATALSESRPTTPPVGSSSVPSSTEREESGEALTPRQIADRTLSSVVIVAMHLGQGQTSQGSGFFVKPRIIATNYHVIEGAAEGVVKSVGEDDIYRIDQILATDKPHDLALLSVNDDRGEGLPLSSTPTVDIGEAVYAIGNPQGLEGTFSEGIVSAIRDGDGQRFIQITAPISEGSSGGPVVNERGEVIGVATATLQGGENLNFAIPVSVLRRLLEQVER